MVLIILIILIVLLVGAVPRWPYSRGWGYWPSGVWHDSFDYPHPLFAGLCLRPVESVVGSLLVVWRAPGFTWGWRVIDNCKSCRGNG